MQNQVIYNIVLGFINLFIFLAAIIVSFDCLWRAEKRLATYLRLVLIALLPFVAKQVFIIIGFTAFEYWTSVDQYLEIVGGALLLISLIQMFRIIKIADKEK